MSRYCTQCGKAKKACICQWIKKLDSDVELIILQHPTEVNRSKGTAKILSLSLANSHCFVGEDFSQHEQLNQMLAEENSQTFVLFPTEQAQLATYQCAQAPAVKGRTRVILLDGTWKKSFKMYQMSSNLHAVPQLSLPDEIIGNYKIRKAPSSNSLSTVEAGYYILTILQPEKDFSPLLQTFNSMIDFYIQQLPQGTYESNYSKSNR